MGMISKKRCTLLEAELKRRDWTRIDPKRELSTDSEVLSRAIEALGSVAGAASWLTRPQHGLGGRLPLEMTRTAKGKAIVIRLLGRIDRGVLA
jgi:uncharacterized protein (DUF2384 family)